MSDNQQEIYDTAERITENVMELLAPAVPIWVHDGGNDTGSRILSDEARAVYDSTVSILESAV